MRHIALFILVLIIIYLMHFLGKESSTGKPMYRIYELHVPFGVTLIVWLAVEIIGWCMYWVIVG